MNQILLFCFTYLAPKAQNNEKLNTFLLLWPYLHLKEKAVCEHA